MDLRLKTGTRPNPEWEIHWTLTGQTHLYGWVDIDGLRCRVTMARVKHRRARRGGARYRSAPWKLHGDQRDHAATSGTVPIPRRTHGS